MHVTNCTLYLMALINTGNLLFCQGITRDFRKPDHVLACLLAHSFTYVLQKVASLALHGAILRSARANSDLCWLDRFPNHTSEDYWA